MFAHFFSAHIATITSPAYLFPCVALGLPCLERYCQGKLSAVQYFLIISAIAQLAYWPNFILNF